MFITYFWAFIGSFMCPFVFRAQWAMSRRGTPFEERWMEFANLLPRGAAELGLKPLYGLKDFSQDAQPICVRYFSCQALLSPFDLNPKTGFRLSNLMAMIIVLRWAFVRWLMNLLEKTAPPEHFCHAHFRCRQRRRAPRIPFLCTNCQKIVQLSMCRCSCEQCLAQLVRPKVFSTSICSWERREREDRWRHSRHFGISSSLRAKICFCQAASVNVISIWDAFIAPSHWLSSHLAQTLLETAALRWIEGWRGRYSFWEDGLHIGDGSETFNV